VSLPALPVAGSPVSCGSLAAACGDMPSCQAHWDWDGEESGPVPTCGCDKHCSRWEWANAVPRDRKSRPLLSPMHPNRVRAVVSCSDLGEEVGLDGLEAIARTLQLVLQLVGSTSQEASAEGRDDAPAPQAESASNGQVIIIIVIIIIIIIIIFIVIIITANWPDLLSDLGILCLLLSPDGLQRGGQVRHRSQYLKHGAHRPSPQPTRELRSSSSRKCARHQDGI
jgi:hypothetical protein